MMFFWMLIVLLVVVRWLYPSDDSRRLPPAEVEKLSLETARLREEVDRLSGQVERLLDEQAFLLRLLEAGPQPRTLEPPEGTGRDAGD